jgi:phosphonatase-like hydrolase
MQIQLVVFDIAGTTVLDRGNINEAFRMAFKTAGIDVLPVDVDKVMGYKKIEAVKIIVQQYAPEMSDDERIINDIHEVFVRNMIEFYENDTDLQPLPFAVDAFHHLKSLGIKVALNTGFTRSITTPILKRLGWDKSELIDATICSDEVAEGRPYPYMIQSLMQRLGIEDVKAVAKIGDTEIDIKEGRNAGCGLVAAVTTGAYSKSELLLHHPDYIFDSMKDFMQLFF